MARNEPQIILVGNAGRDPEMRVMPDGTAVANVTVAYTERKNLNGQWQDVGTTWYRVTAWKDQAEALVENVKKGDKLLVVGRFKVSTYEKDGETKTMPEVNADEIGLVLKGKPKPESRIVEDKWA